MRPLILAVLALSLVPAAALGKPGDAPARVVWNSSPDHLGAGNTWDARLSLVQGPGGYQDAELTPAIVVTDLRSHAERTVQMTVDVPPNTFKAAVPFPRTGLYEVAVKGFDPRDPERFIDYEAPVDVGAARPAAGVATSGDGTSPPWGPIAAAALAALLVGACSVQRHRARATAQSAV
jgi:hypothetical protein